MIVCLHCRQRFLPRNERVRFCDTDCLDTWQAKQVSSRALRAVKKPDPFDVASLGITWEEIHRRFGQTFAHLEMAL
jgi:hypothetical protein